MGKWKKYSFWFLLAGNLIIALFHMWGMLATVLLFALNYRVTFGMTSSMKKMLVLDGTLLITSQAVGWISYLTYAGEVSRTNSDGTGAMILGLINIIHLIASLFLLLLMMILSFWVNGKKRQAQITAGGLAFGILCVGVFLYLIIVPFPYENGSVWIHKDAQYVSNEKYEGRIDFDAESVMIYTHDGRKVASVTKKKLGMYPEQIALGEDFFYVLGGEDYGQDTIVKVDYNSQVTGKRRVGPTDLMTCRDGTIFLGIENEEEDPAVISGYYANRYVAESEFETGEIEACQADGNGVCRVGNEVLYEHEGYFSTNPNISSYKESSYYSLEAGKGLDGKEQTEWMKIVEKLLEQKGLRKMTCFVDDHQEGNAIYGVVNVWDSVLGFPEKRLKCSLAYRISCESKRIEVLWELEGVYMVLATEECILYQDGTELIREGHDKKEKKKLAEISDSSYFDIQISGGYLGIDEGEEERVKWTKGEG